MIHNQGAFEPGVHLIVKFTFKLNEIVTTVLCLSYGYFKENMLVFTFCLKKNITQSFGFLLSVYIGIRILVGEKLVI